MGNILIATLAAFIALIAAAFSTLLAEEFKAWRPRMVYRLTSIAASLLSEGDRDRYHEEWSAYLDDIPGDITKVFAAVGFIWAAFRHGDRRVVALGIKRSMDLAFVTFGLLFLSPMLAIFTIAILIDSRGPVLVRYPRQGRNGKPFDLIKFRVHDMATAGTGELVLTRLGKLMRKSSVEELPQLFNVFRGDMSMVGPRCLPYDFSGDPEMQDVARLRMTMKPGITGLGQIGFGSGDVATRLRNLLVADMIYVKAFSIPLDVGILVKTVLNVLFTRYTVNVPKMAKMEILATVVTLALSALLTISLMMVVALKTASLLGFPIE